MRPKVLVNMWIVINTNKIAYKNLIGAQDSQKQEYVKITSAEEELITIWCEVVQGNVNFLFLIHVWSDFILHMYFWLSFQRISLTFYGHVLHIQYISPFLAKNSCVNVVTQKLVLKLLQNSTKLPTANRIWSWTIWRFIKLDVVLAWLNIKFSSMAHLKQLSANFHLTIQKSQKSQGY